MLLCAMHGIKAIILLSFCLNSKLFKDPCEKKNSLMLIA